MRQAATAVRMILAAAAWSYPAMALAEANELVPTVAVEVEAGYSIYKSGLVQSNDTGITTRYSLSVNGGASHQFGMQLARENSKIAFVDTASSIALGTQDVTIRYRYGYAYLGVVVASSSWNVTEPAQVAKRIDPTATPEDYINLVASGYGANLGMLAPVGRGNNVYADLVYVTTGTVQQAAAGPNGTTGTIAAAKRVSTLGPRLELDLGAAIGLTRSLVDAVVGFKYRSYGVTVDGTAYKEQLNSTYAGLRLNWSF